MNGLDLFSGIGGLTVALSPWVKPVAYCEKDRYAQAVLLSRMSDGEISTAPIWDDITTLLPSMLPRDGIDIIYGGFPCQDISTAGNGAGLEGERSGLFFEIMRLAKEIKPTFVFLENVPAIRTRGLGRIIEEFTEAGYDCRWGMLSAYDVGAPHKRERWFLLANANGERRRSKSLKEKTGIDEINDRHRERKALANTDCLRKLQSSGIKSECWQRIGDGSWWPIEPNVGRVAHGIPKRVDRIKGLGNAVVPAQAREAFQRLMGLK